MWLDMGKFLLNYFSYNIYFLLVIIMLSGEEMFFLFIYQIFCYTCSSLSWLFYYSGSIVLPSQILDFFNHFSGCPKISKFIQLS